MPQMNLAGVYEEQGKLAEAEAALRGAIRLQPQLRAATCPAGYAAAREIARRRPGRDRRTDRR